MARSVSGGSLAETVIEEVWLGWFGEERAVWRLRWCQPAVQLWGVSRGVAWSGGSRL